MPENRIKAKGRMPEDTGGNVIPVPNGVATFDGTKPSSNLSPFSYTANTPFTLQPTDRSQEIVVMATSDLQVSMFEDLQSYFLVPNGVVWTIGCAQQKPIYFQSGSNGTLYFYFNEI